LAGKEERREIGMVSPERKKMTNRRNIFIGIFAIIFSLSAALLSALQYKDQQQIDYIWTVTIAGIMALIGSCIAAGVLPSVPQIEAKTPRIVLVAFRLAVVAALVVVLGGMLAFLGYPKLGWRVGIIGAVAGNIIVWTFLLGRALGLIKREDG